MSDTERIEQYIRTAGIDPQIDEDAEFSLCVQEGFAIKSIGGLEAILLAFDYGRAKGYRAAKLEAGR